MMRTNASTAPNDKYNAKKMTKNKIKYTEEEEGQEEEEEDDFFWP